jgi:hypothetical protein
MNREIYSSGIRTFVLFKCLAALQWPLSLQSESRKKNNVILLISGQKSSNKNFVFVTYVVTYSESSVQCNLRFFICIDVLVFRPFSYFS